MPGEKSGDSIARADGKIKLRVRHHLTVEEWNLSAGERMSYRVGREALEDSVVLDNNGGAVHWDNRKSGIDADIRKCGIQPLISSLGEECGFDFLRIISGAMLQIEIMCEPVPGRSGPVDEDEPTWFLPEARLERLGDFSHE